MNIVVVGGGLAGANAVEELRTQGYTGDITLLGAEPHPPYERPPLSKGVLLGNDEPDSVFVHDAQWYADQQVDLRTGSAATAIDLDGRRVSVGGQDVHYDRLLVATGSQPRHLPVVDRSGADVLHLRTIEDSRRLKEHLSGTLLVIGAGWIGLEVAAAARLAGAEVTVVETAALPLLAVLGPEVAPLFADLHREHGVDLRLGTSIDAVEHDGGTRVRLSDGHEVRPDLVVVGIGAEPSVELAATAGLDVDNGVLVDAALRTANQDVYAAGDVANHDHPVLGRRIRVEHWDAAINQGKHAARAMLGGDEPYTTLPYFFTDQYDLGMEYVGSVGPEGYDEVVVRRNDEGKPSTFLWISRDRVVAGMHVDDWDAIDHLRAVVGREATAAHRDASVPMAEAVSG
jgi:NADPH-dependent 2,4-dienoyl-CoA reductase/sulfur reductase-like enzyme